MPKCGSSATIGILRQLSATQHKQWQHRSPHSGYALQHNTIQGVGEATQHKATQGLNATQHKATEARKSGQHYATHGVNATQHNATQTQHNVTQLAAAFNLVRSKDFHTEHMNDMQTASLIQTLKHLKKPWLYERHVHFLDTQQYGLDLPVYINFIRHPVDRFVSQYYFYRFEHPKPMSKQRRNRTFDECVLGDYEECSTEQGFVIIPFFCGQDMFCLKPSKAALNRAKRNVDRYYHLVGITEDLLASYTLLERTLPQFFTNMSAIAEAKLARLKSVFKTHKKPKPSKTALYIMRTRLALENEFYYYVKHRYVQFLKYYNVTNSVVI